LHLLVTSARCWLSLWSQAGALSQSTRERWLAELSQSTDRYLRSTAFLELMRFNLRTMTRSSRFLAGSPFQIGRSPNGHRADQTP
jgi:hypothetical protein